MSERTHFRCDAFGLLSVKVCARKRQLPPLDARERKSDSSRFTHGVPGEYRPTPCSNCAQAAAVDAGTEPSLRSLAEIEIERGLAGRASRLAERGDALALPATSPIAAIADEMRVPAKKTTALAKPAPRGRVSGDPPKVVHKAPETGMEPALPRGLIPQSPSPLGEGQRRKAREPVLSLPKDEAARAEAAREIALPEGAANLEEATRGLNRFRRWTEGEVAILRADYPLGNLTQLCERLDRKPTQVHEKAHLLGVKRLAIRRRGPAKLKYVPSPEIDTEIRRVYQSLLKDARKGAIKAAAERVGWPAWRFKHRAAELGLATPRTKEPDWSERELRILERNAHFGVDVIQRRLKANGFKRSITGILLKRKRMELTATRLDGYSAMRLAECFGVDGHGVTRWIERGWLTAIKRGTRRTAEQGGDAYWIEQRAVRRFILEYLELIDLAKVDKTWFVDLLTGGAFGRRADKESA